MSLPYSLEKAISDIESNFGVKTFIKCSLLKFGKNPLVGNSSLATVSEMPTGVNNETYVATNLITHFSSSNAGDVQTIVVEGYKLVGSEFRFQRQEVTLAGQTKTALDTPLVRAVRMYNSGTVDLLGSTCVYQDVSVTGGVPDDGTKVHCMMETAGNSSFKGSTTMPYDEYFIITQMMGSVNKKTTASVDMQVEIRLYGKVFRVGAITTLSSTGSNTIAVPVTPHIIVPANADVRLRALSSAANTSVSGWMNGYIAKVKK